MKLIQAFLEKGLFSTDLHTQRELIRSVVFSFPSVSANGNSFSQSLIEFVQVGLRNDEENLLSWGINILPLLLSDMVLR